MSMGILLVDDDPEDQYIFRDALQSIGSTEPVHTEENGLNALNYLLSLPVSKLPFIIMADLNMPKMNGMDLLDHLKGNEDLKSIPVVIYSTSENKMEQENCIKRGAHSYMAKPLNYKQSIKVAEMILQICRERRGNSE